MSILSRFRIPYSEDKVFGFLLLLLCVGSLLTVQGFSEPIDSPRIMAWSILLGLSLIFFIKGNRLLSTAPKPVVIVMGFLWLWSLVATIFSIDHINSLVGVNIRMTSSIWFFSLWLVTVLLFSSLEKPKLLVLLKTWLILGGIVSSWAVLQFFGVGFYEGLNAPVRSLVPSFMGNPNFAAMYIGTTLFITLWFLIKSSSTLFYRYLALLFLGLNVISLGMFASRGAILGTCLGLGVLVLGLLIKKQVKAVIGVAAVLIIAASFSFLYLYSVRTQAIVTNGQDDSTQQRWFVWDHAFDHIIDKPLTGSGLGNYFITYRQNQSAHLANTSWFDDPHNIFLHLAVSGGLPLALAFIILLSFIAWYLYRDFKDSTNNPDLLPLFLAASLVSWIISASFNPVSVSNWLLLALLLGLSMQNLPMRQLANSSAFKKISYLTAFVFIILGSAFAASELSLWLSKNTNQGNKDRVGQFAKAATDLNPTNLAAFNTLGIDLFNNDKIDQSYQAFMQMQKLHPDSSGVMQQVIEGYLNIWQKTQDVKYKSVIYEAIEKYQSDYNNHQYTHANIANYYFVLQDYNLALTAARKAVVLSNGNFQSWIFLSQIYDKLGQPENKQKALESAFRAAPSAELRDLKKQK